MVILDKLLASPTSRSIDEYVEIDLSEIDDETPSDRSMTVSFTEVVDMRDLNAIRTTVYDGNLVIVDLQESSLDAIPFDFLRDELQQVVQEIDGDLVQTSKNQLIVAPTGVAIDRQRL